MIYMHLMHAQNLRFASLDFLPKFFRLAIMPSLDGW